MEATAKVQCPLDTPRHEVPGLKPVAPLRATYQDVLDAPPHVVAEILAGRLVLSPRPALPHALASSQLNVGVGAAFHGRQGGGADPPGGWWILVEPELHLPDPQDPGNPRATVIVPDLAGWRRERLPVLPAAAAMTLAPDWVCEVVSPGTARYDRSIKMRIYAREGVPHLWLVDPLAKTLEVYGLEAGRWVVLGVCGGDESVRAEPFAAVAFDMSGWWLPEPVPAEAEAPGTGQAAVDPPADP